MLSLNANGQDELFGTTKKAARKGLIIGVNGSLDFPAADMAKRYGTSYRVGGNISYKTTKNWLFGINFDFILGSNIKEDSLMINLKDANGQIIAQDGQRIGVGTFQRGYMVGIQGGKIINLGNKNSDNGVLLLTTLGFMQHKINIFDRTQSTPQVSKTMKKGYDRLVNGLFVEQYVGYVYFANNGIVNFNIGLDIAAGFTKGRRDYLYDVMRTDDKARIDILFGIRAGWYIPVFKKKSEEIFFE
ncbi:hypothetical protein CAP35_09995 [Chitinophagaceae bacterium IBVUCB1]|nr:hypothetical protein CAP35_09995 [Chitinophagaceae bacterium IBVUCB1]